MKQPSEPVVRKLKSYNKEQLAKMKLDLGLTMSDASLDCVVEYFAKTEKREPLIEEMKFLDKWNARDAGYASDEITGFFVNSEDLAATYADFMAKRREMARKNPATPIEILGFATEYLARGGKKPAVPNLSVRLENPREFSLGHTGIGISGSDFLLRAIPSAMNSSSPSVGDLFVLITPKDQSARKYRTAVYSLLDSDNFSSVKGRWTVKNGLLSLLINAANGVFVDLRRLGTPDMPASFESLLDSYEGLRVLLIPKADGKKIVKKIEASGFGTTVFASVTEGARVDLYATETKRIRLDTAFLRSFRSRQARRVQIPSDTGCRPVPAQILSATGACKYLKEEKQTDRLILPTGHSVAASYSEIAVNPFESTVEIALAPILTLAAGGCDYSAIRLGIGLNIPQSAEKFNDLTAVALGIYRVQCELGIPAASISILPSECENVALTVYAVTPEQPLSGTFTVAQSSVACVAPKTVRDLPDFDSLRSLLSHLQKLAKEGTVLSAKVFRQASITDGLRTMRKEFLFCNIDDNTILTPDVFPLGILLETNGETPFRVFGHVEAQEEIPVDVSETTPNPLPSLTRLEAPECTLLSSQGDWDALVLAQKIAEWGVTVRRYDTADPAELVARSILTSQILILCPGYSLADGPKTQFALDVFRRSNGVLLSLDETPVSVEWLKAVTI